MMEHSHHEEVVLPLDVEDSIGESPEIRAAHRLTDERIGRGIFPDPEEGLIQLIPECEFQSWRLSGVPSPYFQNVSMCC
jgi:hypothetical protein